MAASHREVWPLDGSFRHPDGMIVPSGSQGHAIEGTFARRWDVNREVAHPPVGPADGVTNGRIHLSDGQRFGEATVLPSVTATGLALGVPTARCYRFELEITGKNESRLMILIDSGVEVLWLKHTSSSHRTDEMTLIYR